VVAGVAGLPSSGVAAVALNLTAISVTGSGHVTAWPSGMPRPATSNVNFGSGQTVANLLVVGVGVGGRVSLLNAAGTTHLVADVQGWFPVGAGFTAGSPVRILDSRIGLGGPASPVSSEPRPVRVLGVGGVPASGVAAVVVNVTALGATRSTSLAVWPAGTRRPPTSTLALGPGQAVAHLVVAAPGAGGSFDVAASGGTADVLVDLQGWFATGAGYVPLPQRRVLDTRTGLGAPKAPVGAGQSIPLVLTGVAGVPPSRVGAVVLNVGVVGPTAPSFVTDWPDAQPAPAPQVSNLNFVARQVVANLVLAKLGPNGAVRLSNSAGVTNLIVDVLGWLPAPPASRVWASVSAGEHTCAIRTDKTLWCWGAGYFGQLGDGATVDRNTPVQVGQGAAWVTVSVGDVHTCAIQVDRSLWCWGVNSLGQVGDGTYVDRNTPVQIGAASWTTVSAGLVHGCAIRTDHSLWCWGANGSGQIGDGTTVDRSAPVRVGRASTWATVSAGRAGTCATRADHTLWCWGDNQRGEVGDGTTVDRHSPVQIGRALTWITVSAGSDHTCAIRTDHTLWCWGDNARGAVGDGTTVDRHSPVRVGTIRSWTTVAAGQYTTCATRSDHSLWCWGFNIVGQVGDGTRVDRHSPVRVDTVSTWATVSAGSYATCATRTDDSLWCWGYNFFGELGLGDGDNRWLPNPLL
jgi:alpha-tubulin suppressor-like RCC1 family protein